MSTHNLKNHKLTIGVKTYTGFGDGSAVIVARVTEAATMIIGSTGEGHHNLINDQSGTITVRIDRSSSENAFLSALSVLQELSGAGEVAITYEDINGGDVHSALSCRLQKMPDGDYTNDMGGLDYVFNCLQLDMWYGGD